MLMGLLLCSVVHPKHLGGGRGCYPKTLVAITTLIRLGEGLVPPEANASSKRVDINNSEGWLGECPKLVWHV